MKYLSILIIIISLAFSVQSQSSLDLENISQQMSIEMGGNRFGSATFSLKQLDSTDPLYQKGFRYSMEESVDLRGVTTLTRATVKEDLSLGEFHFEFRPANEERAKLISRASVEGDKMKVEVESTGLVTEKVLSATETIYPLSLSHLPILEGGLTVGETFEGLGIEPMAQTLAPFTVKVIEKTSMEALGKKWPVAKIIIEYEGIQQTSWMTDQGLRLRDEAMNGMLISNIEPKTSNEDTEPVKDEDIANMMSQLIDELKVKLEGTIPSPRRCKKLVLEVKGITKEDLVLDSYWQKLFPTDTTTDEKTFQIEITLRPQEELNRVDLTPFLESSMLIQSDAPAIKEQALKIVSNANTDREKVERICGWVYLNMDRSSLRLTIPSAVEVLQTMKGDCNEHATLFAALARAAKIPAKVCVGAMYVSGSFYYHAWNEVFLEKTGWIPVDTTLNQIPADATHLKLAEGEMDQQTGVLRSVGQLRLKVVESE